MTGKDWGEWLVKLVNGNEISAWWLAFHLHFRPTEIFKVKRPEIRCSNRINKIGFVLIDMCQKQNVR